MGLDGACNPRALDHFGLCGSVTVDNAPTTNCDSNSTLGTITRITSRILPHGCACRFNNVSHRRSTSKGGIIIVFMLYVILICLVLDTVCRDLMLPFAVVLSIPYKLVNYFLFTRFFKLRGGVCLRANLVVLVNLLTGATVLVASCTNSHHHSNVSVGRTTVNTTMRHLHPVLVATLAVVFNVLPLVFTSNMKTGNGSTLNAKTINNVLVNALMLLFLIPAL